MKTMLKRFFIALLLLTPLTAFAFIPKFWLILSRTAENHGRGNYKVEQNVVFNHLDEPLIVHEKWIISDENSMRLEVEGRGALKDKIRLVYVYDGPRKYYLNEEGKRKAVRTSNEWFEPYFHFRRSKNIKPLLIANKIVPAEALKKQKRIYSIDKITYEPESFVRLSRTGGVVNYALGSPTPPDSIESLPGFWVEQDKFVIRKMRFPSQLTILANKYAKYSRELWLPKQREILWNGNTSSIHILDVKGLSGSPKIKELLDPKKIIQKDEEPIKMVLPEDSVIQDFYTKLR